jgi:hypothetical protein
MLPERIAHVVFGENRHLYWFVLVVGGWWLVAGYWRLVAGCWCSPYQEMVVQKILITFST